MDLDDEELKATKKLHEGSVKKLEPEKDEQEEPINREEAERKIQEAIDKLNEACEAISNLDIMKHAIVIGYVDAGIASGFISSKYNLEHLESTTTFLLDFSSRNIKESVRQTAQKQAENIKNIIEEEEKKNEDELEKQQ